jgi:class 3 adenylate cyclase
VYAAVISIMALRAAVLGDTVNTASRLESIADSKCRLAAGLVLTLQNLPKFYDLAVILINIGFFRC